MIIKDHFEFSVFSRQLLRLAYFFGNYAYGVKIPKRYFNQKTFNKLTTTVGYREIKLIKNVKIHDGFFDFILKSKYHFISILSNK